MFTSEDVLINYQLNQIVQDMSDFLDTTLVCGRCGGEAYRKAPDYVDYCDECGVVEGICEEIENDETIETAQTAVQTA